MLIVPSLHTNYASKSSISERTEIRVRNWCTYITRSGREGRPEKSGVEKHVFKGVLGSAFRSSSFYAIRTPIKCPLVEFSVVLSWTQCQSWPKTNNSLIFRYVESGVSFSWVNTKSLNFLLRAKINSLDDHNCKIVNSNISLIYRLTFYNQSEINYNRKDRTIYIFYYLYIFYINS